MRFALNLPVVTLALSLMAMPAHAADPVAMDELRLNIVQYLQAGPVAKVRENLMAQFRRVDQDGRGVSKASYELADSKRNAMQRANQVTQYLLHDLNGDARATREELTRALSERARQPMSQSGVPVEPTPEQSKQVLDKLVADLMVADTNGDGAIDIAEMIARADGMNPRQANHMQQKMVPLGLDGNNDQVVSQAEFAAAVDQILKEFDGDADGIFSEAERQAAHGQVRDLQQAKYKRDQAERQALAVVENAKRCKVPAVPAGAHVSVVGSHQGAAFANVALGSGLHPVYAAQVDIQAGTQPLYVIATSDYPMVWHVTGAADRVAQFVVMSSQASSAPVGGTVGLPKERVAIVSTPNCMPHVTGEDDAQIAAARAAVTALLSGRAPDVVAGRSTLARVRLPIGTTSTQHAYDNAAPAFKSVDALAVLKAARTDGVVVAFDPASVVADVPVQRVAVLPGAAGLAQLIEQGVLQVSEYANVIMLGNTKIIGGGVVRGADGANVLKEPSGYRIVGKMQFPAGLHGGHSARFTVAPGVAMPTNSPGHSKVMCETTKKPLKPGELCPWTN